MEHHPQQVTLDEARRFAVDCFLVKNRAPHGHAIQMADALVGADCRGHFSHGLNRLEMYVNELDRKTADGWVVPAILNETIATAWVDGRNGLGMVVGNWCMDLAVEKAKQVGIGLVCCKGSNHYGMAGWYTMRAEQSGLIGISMSNSSPSMVSTRSAETVLGTNPIAFAAPALRGDAFRLDMATTTAALGKIELKLRMEEKCPEGWAQDSAGRSTTDPKVAWHANCLMPLGGGESTSGYKGYGLAAMVEILCGVLGGGAFGKNNRKWALDGGTTAPDLGHMFMAIDPLVFAPNFANRLSTLTAMLRDSHPVSALYFLLIYYNVNSPRLTQPNPFWCRAIPNKCIC